MRRKLRPNCCVCGKEVARPDCKFCSNRCQMEHQYRDYVAAWKAGLVSGIQAPYSVSNHIKRYLIEKYGERCQKCGWAERHPMTGKVPLNVEHVDGRWDNCCEDNLLLLCPNCHSLTPTFGNLNRGRGRAARYKKLPL